MTAPSPGPWAIDKTGWALLDASGRTITPIRCSPADAEVLRASSEMLGILTNLFRRDFYITNPERDAISALLMRIAGGR